MKNPNNVRIPWFNDPFLYLKGERIRETGSVQVFQMLFKKSCRFALDSFPWLAPKGQDRTTDELEEDIKFINMDLRADGVVALSRLTMVSSLIILLPIVSFLIFRGGSFFFIFLLIIPFILSYIIVEYPKNLAGLERMKALSYAPEIVTYLVIPLKQSSSLEEATEFAATHGKGRISEDLKEMLWGTWGREHKSVADGLINVGLRWGRYLDGFKNAIYMVRASQLEKSEGSRINMLNKAVNTILSNVIKKFGEFADSLVKPVLILLNFGIILPLITTSILPLMVFSGGSISQFTIGIVLLTVVMGIFLYTSNILRKRPPTFPPIRVPDEHPGLNLGKINFLGNSLPIKPFVIALVFLIALPGLLYLIHYNSPIVNLFTTAPILLAIALGAFIYLRYSIIEKKRVRDEIEEMEQESVDAFYQLGNRLDLGVAPEEVLSHVAKTMEKSKISRIFTQALGNINERNMDLERAFFDEHEGSLKGIYSDRIKNLVEVFVKNTEKGSRVASQALLTTINYMMDINKVTDDVKRKTSSVVSTMKLTAAVIAPVICGIMICTTTLLSTEIEKNVERMSSIGSNLPFIDMSNMSLLKPMELSPEILQLMVGLYLISIALLLARFTSILEKGDDSISSRIGMANTVLIATIVFLSVVAISNFLMSGLFPNIS